jgi:kynurenine 3-monooxygenase
VQLFDFRPDPRASPSVSGYGVGLLLSQRSERAIGAALAGDARRLDNILSACTVPIEGRRIHEHGRGGSHFVGWGRGGNIKAVDRLALHQQLIQQADDHQKVKFCFEHEVVGVDMRARRLKVASTPLRGKESAKVAGPSLGIRHRSNSRYRTDANGKADSCSSVREEDDYDEYEYDLLVGADGAYSTIRQHLVRQCPEVSCQESVDPIVYKWLSIFSPKSGPLHDPDSTKEPLDSSSEKSVTKSAPLELDPTCINLLPTPYGITVHALPTPTGGYNLTFMLPTEAANATEAQNGTKVGEARLHNGIPSYSIDSTATLEDIEAMFQHAVPHLLALDPSLPRQFQQNPVGEFRTVSLSQYHDAHAAEGGGCSVLIGDAAHAMPPYFGQAMNIALEDAAVLGAMVGAVDPLGKDPLEKVRLLVQQFSDERIGEARACQAMTAEQRGWILHHSRSPFKRFQQEYHKLMHSLLPSVYCPTARSMVNYHGMRYQDAWEKQQRQNQWWKLGRVYE